MIVRTKSSGIASVVSGGCSLIALNRMLRNAAIVGDCRSVHVGVEVQLPVAELRKEIDARLTLGDGERCAVEREKTLRDRLELLRVPARAPASSPRARASEIGVRTRSIDGGTARAAWVRRSRPKR